VCPRLRGVIREGKNGLGRGIDMQIDGIHRPGKGSVAKSPDLISSVTTLDHEGRPSTISSQENKTPNEVANGQDFAKQSEGCESSRHRQKRKRGERFRIAAQTPGEIQLRGGGTQHRTRRRKKIQILGKKPAVRRKSDRVEAEMREKKEADSIQKFRSRRQIRIHFLPAKVKTKRRLAGRARSISKSAATPAKKSIYLG